MADKNLLIVEGFDDQHVIDKLWRRYHNLGADQPLPFQIKPEEGIEKLKDSLAVRLKLIDEDRTLQCLGIVVDADTDLDARWKSLSNIFKKAGYTTVPEHPHPEGTIIKEEHRIAIGVWLMPDNQIPGTLERFIEFLRPQNDRLWERAGDAVQSIPPADRLFAEVDLLKAHIHTWLAWQKIPGRPMGLAIKAGYLDANAPHAQQLVAWLNRLFGLTP
jgi:hypothetical protein